MIRSLVTSASAWLIALSPVLACTDARIIAVDGTPFTVRTMEFELDLKTALVIAPRGLKTTSPAPNGGSGLTWTGKYGYVYMNAMGKAVATDGLNEAGLGFGALYPPGETEYQTVAAGAEGKALSNLAFGAWVLSSFAKVEEVRAAVPNVIVWAENVPQLGSFSPLHYVVHDASGKSIVIEYVGGEVHVYDHQVGVLTNSPTYEWHIQNLRNYVNLTPLNTAPVKLGSATYASTGQGAGLHGLPGDPTPPSRFVNVAASLFLGDKPKDAKEAFILANHLINRVDIPKGLVRNYATGGGEPEGDYTQWTVFRDHRNLVYSWRTYENPAVQALDLKTVDFSPGQVLRGVSIARPGPSVTAVDAKALAPIELSP